MKIVCNHELRKWCSNWLCESLKCNHDEIRNSIHFIWWSGAENHHPLLNFETTNASKRSSLEKKIAATRHYCRTLRDVLDLQSKLLMKEYLLKLLTDERKDTPHPLAWIDSEASFFLILQEGFRSHATTSPSQLLLFPLFFFFLVWILGVWEVKVHTHVLLLLPFIYVLFQISLADYVRSLKLCANTLWQETKRFSM